MCVTYIFFKYCIKKATHISKKCIDKSVSLLLFYHNNIILS